MGSTVPAWLDRVASTEPQSGDTRRSGEPPTSCCKSSTPPPR